MDFLRRKAAPLFALAMAGAALAIAFTAQWGFGLYPCALCVWQRWAYAATLVLALAALALPGRAGARLAALGFLAVAGIAFYHVGVEQRWWQGSAACSGADLSQASDLKAAILAGPVVSCTDIPWQFAGLSMAGFNVVFALIFAAVTWWLAGRAHRRSPP